MDVSLSWPEVAMACRIGVTRHIAALRRDLPDRHGIDRDDGWRAHIEGACGEMAFAKAVDRYWCGSINTFRAGGDVGDIQVRTRSRHDYELIVRASDRDGDAFVLVTGAAPNFRVRGWIRGAAAKNAQWIREHGGRAAAYFVPHAALRPVLELSLCTP